MTGARAPFSLIICLVALLENSGVSADFYGGWSLDEQQCPSGAAVCKSGICCPANTFCHDQGIAWACCPDRTDCGPTIKSFPVCADPSLVLYKGRYSGGYFCCPSDQQGIYPANGAAGLCVASNMPVSATQSAVKVTPNSAVSVATGSSASFISKSSAATTSSAFISVATTTTSESSAAPSTSSQSASTQGTAAPSTTASPSTQGPAGPGTTVNPPASTTTRPSSSTASNLSAGVAVMTAIGAILSVFIFFL